MVLAHNTEPDPVFIYANRTAQRCFEYAWESLHLFPLAFLPRRPTGPSAKLCSTRSRATVSRQAIAERASPSPGVAF